MENHVEMLCDLIFGSPFGIHALFVYLLFHKQ